VGHHGLFDLLQRDHAGNSPHGKSVPPQVKIDLFDARQPCQGGPDALRSPGSEDAAFAGHSVDPEEQGLARVNDAHGLSPFLDSCL
jgi:hypothetical protein